MRYVIGSVRNATPGENDMISAHVAGLELGGYQVYYPKRDAPQADKTGFNIVMSELVAMHRVESQIIRDKPGAGVDVIWNPESEGSHVDLGMAYALLPLANIHLIKDPDNCFPLKQDFWLSYMEMMNRHIKDQKSSVYEFEWLADWKTDGLMQERIEQRLMLGIALASLSTIGGLQIQSHIRGSVDHGQKSYVWVLREIEKRQKKEQLLFESQHGLN